MAEVKPGTKECDRCKKFEGIPQKIVRRWNPADSDSTPDLLIVAVDLCKGCMKLVDNAIKRAVKAK